MEVCAAARLGCLCGLIFWAGPGPCANTVAPGTRTAHNTALNSKFLFIMAEISPCVLKDVHCYPGILRRSLYRFGLAIVKRNHLTVSYWRAVLGADLDS